MSNRYDFHKMNLIGKWAELRVLFYFRRKKSVHEVAVVADDPRFRRLDVDLVVFRENSSTRIEVKADRYTTGNIYIEEVSRHFDGSDQGTRGCLVYTQADYVFYYFVRQGRALLLPVKALQAWIEAGNLSRFQAAHPRTVTKGRELYRSTGYPVPEATLCREIPGVVEIVGLEVLSPADERIIVS